MKLRINSPSNLQMKYSFNRRYYDTLISYRSKKDMRLKGIRRNSDTPLKSMEQLR